VPENVIEMYHRRVSLAKNVYYLWQKASGLWIDNSAVKTLLNDTGNISQKGRLSHITSREQEIIGCIRQGLSNREIALRLTLSLSTVKTHLNNIFKKLNVTSRSKLIALAMNRAQGPSA
jgi:DNA-binding NarL/FixJ family response regulator